MTNRLTREQWAEQITKTWYSGTQTMVDAIIAVARDLEKAKDELDYGEFTLMFEQKEVPFSEAKGRKFRIIANCPQIVLRSHENVLPPDWNTLYLLTRLAKHHPDQFDQFIADGTINTAMARAEIAKILRLLGVQADEARVLALRPVIGKFCTLVFDPAWEYEDLSIAGRANPDYAKQTLDQLRTLDIMQWVDKDHPCHLYCWATNNFALEAGKLIEQWGFQYHTMITWIKPPPFGLGRHFRNSTEQVLFAKLGDTGTRHAAASIPTHFEAPRGEHSEKPEKFYEIVRASSYPPYGEGNQREARPDFTNLFEEIAADDLETIEATAAE